MAESYGEQFAEIISGQARYHDRGDLFRRLDISRNQFYNVTNPNRSTSGGNPYPFPMEWMVRATREFHDYSLIKMVAGDCGGIFLSPEDVADLDRSDAAQVIEVFREIISHIRGEKKAPK